MSQTKKRQRLRRTWKRFVREPNLRRWIRVQVAAAEMDLDAIQHFSSR
jgi:hypothetical protein